MRDIINLVEAATVSAKLETTPLPYGLKDLDPVLSENNLVYHYEHLAKGYAKRYNAGEGDPDFNRAGSFLHTIRFKVFLIFPLIIFTLGRFCWVIFGAVT